MVLSLTCPFLLTSMGYLLTSTQGLEIIFQNTVLNVHTGEYVLLKLATDVYCARVSSLWASICQDLCVHQSPIQFEIEDTRKNTQKLLEWKMFVAYLTRIFISSAFETLKNFSKLNTTTCRRGVSFFIMSPQIATMESGTDFRKARNETTKFLKYCGVAVGYGSIILNFVLYNK